VVTVAHAGLVPLLISLFAILTSLGIVFPIGTAAALANQQVSLGGASALLGTGQFGMGAIVAPLVGLAGPHDAVPMGIVIGICGISALAVDAGFSQKNTRGFTATST
jgi:DHA1 family bicyclomycin/chloramphenicol resistance-like MFS transporter